MFTYIATNTNNGKFYIGSTTDFNRRKLQHLSCKRNTPFHNSLRNSPDIFVWEVFEDLFDEPVLEQALLDKWFGVKQCYNLCSLAGRPQNNPESSRLWGLKNGPIRGRQTYEDKVGIFDPSAPRLDWSRKGGKATASKLGKPVLIVSPEGEEFFFASVKEAVREGPLSYATLKRCLKEPNRKLRSGFTARYA
jgi:hypothetical protein